LVLDIPCVTYILTSEIMPDRQTSDMRQIRKGSRRFLWHQLALASWEFHV